MSNSQKKFPVAQTGLDYTRLHTSLNNSKTQKENNSLYQTVNGLIDGASKFQGFLEGKFFNLDSTISELFTGAQLILGELALRNSTKFSVSLTNAATQVLPDSSLTQLTFDTTVFDDGLMFDGSSVISLNANAQFMIGGRVLFAAGTSGIRRISVHLNGARQFSTEFTALADEIIIPYWGYIEALDGDLVTVHAYQENAGDLAIIPSLQLFRVTYVNLGSGRNVTEGSDGTSGGGGGGGTTCDPLVVPPPSGPTWYTDILTAHSVSPCWNVADMAAMESDFNAQNYWYQRNSAGDIRGRMFYPTPDSFGQYVDIARPDGGWGWFQHGF